MAQHAQNRTIHDAVELLRENGFEGLGEAVTVLLNSAMVAERSDYLQAAPYERSTPGIELRRAFAPSGCFERVRLCAAFGTMRDARNAAAARAAPYRVRDSAPCGGHLNIAPIVRPRSAEQRGVKPRCA